MGCCVVCRVVSSQSVDPLKTLQHLKVCFFQETVSKINEMYIIFLKANYRKIIGSIKIFCFEPDYNVHMHLIFAVLDSVSDICSCDCFYIYRHLQCLTVVISHVVLTLISLFLVCAHHFFIMNFLSSFLPENVNRV